MSIGKASRILLAVAGLLVFASSGAEAGGTLRVALTASDVPTTTGAPDNGGEGPKRVANISLLASVAR